MKLIQTAKIKLNISIDEILPTFAAYTKAFNFVCSTGYFAKIYNGIKLHHKTYRDTREYLPSQLAISARMKATEALKSIKGKTKRNRNDKSKPKFIPIKCPQSKLCSIHYDINSYSIFPKTNEISLLTINGRKRYPLIIPEYFKDYFQTWKYSSADLVISKRTKSVYIHIVFQKDITDVQSNGNYIGIDRGINNLAVSSTNKFYGGQIIKEISNRYQKLRSELQSKGTKSAKRHLRKVSGKEKRFRADVNHCIAKKIVSELQPGDTIVLENLSGIRKNKRLKKEQRSLLNSWNFYQLEQFIIYKAAARGISVVFVDPRYTSQRCSKCGHTIKSNRNGSQFCCKQCGFKLNADLNASRNICIKYLDAICNSEKVAVNQPNVSGKKEISSSGISSSL